jgi:hypothetical protein
LIIIIIIIISFLHLHHLSPLSQHTYHYFGKKSSSPEFKIISSHQQHHNTASGIKKIDSGGLFLDHSDVVIIGGARLFGANYFLFLYLSMSVERGVRKCA